MWEIILTSQNCLSGMYLRQNKHLESLCCMYLVHTLGYQIGVGLSLFIDEIFLKMVMNQKLTAMPRWM